MWPWCSHIPCVTKSLDPKSLCLFQPCDYCLGRRFENSHPSRTNDGLFLLRGNYILQGEDMRTHPKVWLMDKHITPCWKAEARWLRSLLWCSYFLWAAPEDRSGDIFIRLQRYLECQQIMGSSGTHSAEGNSRSVVLRVFSKSQGHLCHPAWNPWRKNTGTFDQQWLTLFFRSGPDPSDRVGSCPREAPNPFIFFSFVISLLFSVLVQNFYFTPMGLMRTWTPRKW